MEQEIQSGVDLHGSLSKGSGNSSYRSKNRTNIDQLSNRSSDSLFTEYGKKDAADQAGSIFPELKYPSAIPMIA